MTAFGHKVLVRPAWDHREPGHPYAGLGAHPAELHFVLTGKNAAVHLVISTGWMVRPLTEPWLRESRMIPPMRSHRPGIDEGLSQYFPAGRGLFIHYGWKRPEFSGGHGHCEFSGARQCWLEVSMMESERLLEILISQGDAGLWQEMAKSMPNEASG